MVSDNGLFWTPQALKASTQGTWRQRSPFSRHPFRHLIQTTTFRVTFGCFKWRSDDGVFRGRLRGVLRRRSQGNYFAGVLRRNRKFSNSAFYADQVLILVTPAFYATYSATFYASSERTAFFKPFLKAPDPHPQAIGLLWPHFEFRNWIKFAIKLIFN